MVPYVLLFSIIYICALFDVTKGNFKIKNLIFLFLVIIITLFAGLRHNIGADYLGYYSYYKKATISLFGDLEIGFEVLAVFVRTIFNSYEFFVLTLVTLTFVFMYKAIKNLAFSNMYLIPLYVFSIQYLLGGPMGQMRQALAIAILLYSIKFIIDGSFRKFLFAVLMASCIHVTSIIFLIAYAVNYIKISKTLILTSMATVVMLGNTSVPRDVLLQLSTMLNIDIFATLGEYVTSERYGMEYEGSILAYIERLLLLFVTLYFFKDSKDKKVKTLILIYWISLLIFFLFMDISILAQRLSRPFKLVEIFLYGYILQSFTKNSYLRVVGFLILSLLLYKPIFMIISRPHQYIPYNSIWGN
jgi:EpsG family